VTEWREVGLAEDESPVGDAGERGEGFGAQPNHLLGRCEDNGVDGDTERHQEKGGEQSARSTGPEPGQAYVAGGAPFAEKEAGDQVAAEDEEGVDTEETAASPDKPRMVGEDGADRQGAHAVERRLVG
jgi:hypothetical protein